MIQAQQKKLVAERNELARELRALAKEFTHNGQKWPSDEKETQWHNASNAYDEVADNLRLSNTRGDVTDRMDGLDRHETESVNPHNIGLPNVTADGRFGGAGNTKNFVEDSHGKRHQVFGKGDSVQAAYQQERGRSREDRELSLGSYLGGMVNGHPGEVVQNALREGTDSSGGFTVPKILSSQLIDRTREKTRVMEAGAQTLILDSDLHSFAKVLADPVPGWRLELGAVAESQPTFGKVEFVPRSLAVLVKASHEVIEDSVNLGTALLDILASAMAQEIDRVALAGTGVAPQPKGLLANGNITTIDPEGGVGTAPSSFMPFLDAVEQLESNNTDGPFSAILHPRTKRQFDSLTDSTGQPLRRPEAVAGIPMLATTMMPIDEDSGGNTDASSVLVGDFSDLVIGMRSQVRIDVLKERYADTLEYGFLVTLRMDVQTWRDESFVRLHEIRKV